ncbi:MAG: 6-phosphogluconolactonase [Paracoccaceae bacterium]
MSDTGSISASHKLVKSWTVGSAKILVFDGRDAMAGAAAEAIARQIRVLAQTKPVVRMIFAAAPSQAEVLSKLCNMPDIPWSQVTAFHMDDYLGIAPQAPQRFANWLDHHLFKKVNFKSVHRIASSGASEDICTSYAELLSEAPIDIVCLGIGVNGHIAFNDPPVADFDDPQIVKVVELDDICRQQQVDDECFAKLSDVPTHAVTLTVPTLLSAGALYCIVPGAHKRAAIKAALETPISTSCPASILRKHQNSILFLDPEAAP